LIALLLCTPKYIEGMMTLGEVVQAAAAFGVVQGAFNWVTDSYGRIAEWAASANRVASLLLALDQIDGQASPGAIIPRADRNEFGQPAGTLTND
jgi:putative ATP-binding cassette transporter